MDLSTKIYLSIAVVAIASLVGYFTVLANALEHKAPQVVTCVSDIDGDKWNCEYK